MSPSLLDALIAEPEFCERHSCEVLAPPARAWAATRALTAAEIRALGPLLAIRSLPAAVRDPRQLPAALRRARGRLGSRPVLEQFLDAGFIELGERPGREVAAGAVGRFWSLARNGPLVLAGAQEFERFDRPGHAKVGFNLVVEPSGAGSRVVTETRVVTTSPDAHRAFARYWRLILPGSALIRRSWLAAIRRRAESG